MMNPTPSSTDQHLRIQIVVLALIGLLLIGLAQISLVLAVILLLLGTIALSIALPRQILRPTEARPPAHMRQVSNNDSDATSPFRSSKANFRRLVETASEGVLVADADNIITFANKQIATMLGYTENELLGRNILTLFAEEDPLSSNNNQPSNSEELNDFRLQQSDGSTLWAIISTTPLIEDNIYSGVLLMITDITERKKAEAALRKNQQFIERMTHTLPDIVYIYDLLELRPTYQNRRLAEQLGYSAEEIAAMGQNHEMDALLHPDDQTRLGDLVMQLVQAAPGDIVETVFRMRHKDGSWHWINIREIVFDKTPDGLPRQLLGLARDVTERIQGEALQQENEKRYKALWAESQRQAQELRLLDEVRTLLAREQDIPTMIRSAITQIAESFGYPLVCLYLLEEETLKLQYKVGLSGAEPVIPITQGITGRVARTGEMVYLTDVRKDPDFISEIDNITSAIYAPLVVNQRVIGTLNVESTEEFMLTPDDVRLVTSLGQHISIALSQAQLNTSLRDSEARFRQIAENINQVFWVRDTAERRLLYISPIFETIWRRPIDTVYQDADAFYDTVHPADLGRVHARHATQEGQEQSDEYRIVWPDGTIRWINVRIYPVYDEAGKLYREVGLAEDVTERRDAETLVRRQRDYLDALHQTTLDLMSRLDLTTLLNDILSRASGLLGTKHGYICLRNDEDHVIEAVATQGVFPANFRLQLGEGISGRVWQSGQPMWVNDYQHTDDHLPDLG
ncbi:MAG: PAS domain S-box protein, partial [Anaerolineae bacterium]|nr:PAS domain S-box protein [Anaerolineae bacterium]